MSIKNIVSPDFAFYKDFINYEKGFKDGYEKGVIEMWMGKNMWCEVDNENCKECNVNVCPEAQKLLKKNKAEKNVKKYRKVEIEYIGIRKDLTTSINLTILGFTIISICLTPYCKEICIFNLCFNWWVK